MKNIEAFIYDSDLSDLVDNKVISEKEVIQILKVGVRAHLDKKKRPRNKAPKFVKLGEQTLRLEEDGKTYYRDAGYWSVGYRFLEGELLSWYPGMKHIHRKPLVEVTEADYKKDNKGYL